MNITSLLKNFEMSLFSFKKEVLPVIAKIAPKPDESDLEPGNYYKIKKVRYDLLDANELDIDLESGKFYNHITSDEKEVCINNLNKCKIIENYVSFMEIVSYLATPIKDRVTINGLFELSNVFSDVQTNEGRQSNSDTNDIIDDNSVDIPLHLSRSSMF